MMDAALTLLREIQALLARYSYDRPASLVGRVISTVDPGTFWALVGGLDFWGGAGAVWEVEPFGMSHPDSRTATDDYRRFQVLMIELAEILKSEGLDAMAARNADLFRRELEDGR